MGIGRSACLLMAREGARVAVADREEAAGKAVAEEIRAAGGEADYWNVDVASESSVK